MRGIDDIGASWVSGQIGAWWFVWCMTDDAKVVGS